MYKQMKTGFDVASTLLVIVVAGLTLYRLYASTPVLPGGKPQVEKVDGMTIPISALTNVRGSGRVYLLEFADFECPFCATYHREAGAKITSDLVNRGRIRQAFLHFPIATHAHAYTASRAAECAAQQGRFWEMYDSLFASPKTLGVDDLNDRAQRLNLDVERFTACVETSATAQTVDNAAAEGRRLGVNATPTFFVGFEAAPGIIQLRQRINGLTDFSTFAAAISSLPQQQ